MYVCFFFFQAEDGIRDAQESRGLGDVYKRQVIMNPPFGAQAEHADRPFLDMALNKAGTIYGIFNAGSRSFIAGYIRDRGEIVGEVQAGLAIPRTFWFHSRDRHEIPVEIYVIKRFKKVK